MPKDIDNNVIRYMLLSVFEAGLRMGKNWVFNNELKRNVDKLIINRERLLIPSHKEELNLDGWLYILSTISTGISHYEDRVMQKWDFYDASRKVIKEIEDKFDLSKLTPLPYGSNIKSTYKEEYSKFSQFDDFG
jgi:hypothetical protein